MQAEDNLPIYGWRKICEIFGQGNFLHGKFLLLSLARGLSAAETKHPDYAKGKHEALELTCDEMREFIQAVEYEDEERQKAEARDLAIVPIRFLRGDHNAHR